MLQLQSKGCTVVCTTWTSCTTRKRL